MDLLLSKLRTQNLEPGIGLEKEELASLIYHDIFDYPLTLPELIKWKVNLTIGPKPLAINYKDGFYFLSGRDGLVFKRLLRKRISERKLEIANKAGRVLSFIPSVKMVGITGALAMENATEDSDIDLVIVTKKGTLWTTRAFAYLFIYLFGIKFRRAGRRDERDKLCLNMWLNENRLTWPKKDRNVYTSHEIAQIVPLVNKDETYEKFIWKNRWILDFWPNSVRVSSKQQAASSRRKNLLLSMVEKLAFFLQRFRKNKIGHEVVTPTRAIFHPNDWGKIVLGRLHT